MTLLVERANGLATVQDLGRRGRMHEAVPPGGALVPALLAAANRRAHNPDGAPAIELFGRLVVRAVADITVATPERAHALLAGDELAIESERHRCTYLAVRGGVAAPERFGGRGALLCAGIGAPLRAGDPIDCARADELIAPVEPLSGEANPVRVVPGPDLDAFEPGALDQLTTATYRVLPTSDRVGTRLAGLALPRRPGYRERSRPLVIGALEVPRDGQPIALGPEHPTTGGYPVLAVIASADLDRFFAIRLGDTVRFATAPVTSSR